MGYFFRMCKNHKNITKSNKTHPIVGLAWMLLSFIMNLPKGELVHRHYNSRKQSKLLPRSQECRIKQSYMKWAH